MMLRFPNPSRSFDASKSRISFWGYDSAIEVSFYIDAATLKHLSPDMNEVESGFLLTFDAEREHIYEMANRAYMRGGSTFCSHTLAVEDA